MKINELYETYETKKNEIQKRLEEFKKILKESDERVFAELVFCICTPQSKATNCWNCVSNLMKNDLLLNGNEKQVVGCLSGVRFPENKTKYIVEARIFFTKDGKLNIKEKILSLKSAFELREWLVKNIKGVGMKEASHFIRNIGFDYNNQLAILDRHILKNLRELGVIEETPKILTKNIYLEIENRMRNFSEKMKIPLYELDLLLWSKETGKVFK